MNEEEDIELIDRFMQGALSAHEADAVKKRIESDEQFAAVYNDVKYLVEATRVAGRKDLVEYLVKEDKEHNKSRTINWYWVSGIAATFIIAAFFMFNRPSSSLVDEYFVPYPNTVVPVIRGTPTDSSLRAEAFRFYEFGEYESALKTFKQIQPVSTEDLFYMGVSAVGMKDYTAAVAYLENYETKGEAFIVQAKWYLALAYAGSGNTEMARRYLERISRGKSGYEKQAEEVLSKM